MTAKMPGTGRARSCVSFLLGPESMRQYRFQILTWLLILWQLLLPTGAPWLHTVVDGSCCASSNSHDTSTACCHHRHSNHAESKCGGLTGEDREVPHDSAPHDCSNCAICQAISTPRVLALLIELPVFSEQTGLVSVSTCADPMLGFGLPPQCRAPPVA